MTVKVRLDDRRLVALPAALEKLADQICNKAAKNIETRAKIKIQSPPKTGRIYRHGNVEHQASAPGEAPATDTGNLVNSIASDRVRPMRMRLPLARNIAHAWSMVHHAWPHDRFSGQALMKSEMGSSVKWIS